MQGVLTKLCALLTSDVELTVDQIGGCVDIREDVERAKQLTLRRTARDEKIAELFRITVLANIRAAIDRLKTQLEQAVCDHILFSAWIRIAIGALVRASGTFARIACLALPSNWVLTPPVLI